MSEMEDLKHNAAVSKAKQQMEELVAYLERLNVTIDLAYKKYRQANVIYMVTWLVWVAAGFYSHWFSDFCETLFILALIYDAFRFARLRESFGEFYGAMEILRIMGMAPPRPDPRERKKQRLFSEGIEMVKRWAASKKKAQEEVYAPA